MIWVQIDESQIGFYQKNNFGLPVREDRCLFLKKNLLHDLSSDRRKSDWFLSEK